MESRRIAAAALAVLPAALMGYLAFNSGGFFPGAPAYAAALLAITLMIRTTLAEDPFQGLGARVVFAGAAMALYALEALLSQEWSHAPGVALVEFDLPLLYLLALVLFGSVAHTAQRLAWIVRALTIGIVVVCACGLITRLLPNVWPITPELANNRLAFPLTYWNALGLLAALGTVLCLHFASDPRERPAARVLAAAAIPVQACTLYFTFSRGGILGALLAVAVYVALGRPRALLSALIATVPVTAVALVVAYHANLLATTNPTTPQAVSQGHRVALVLAACVVGAALLRGALLLLDRRLKQLALPGAIRRRAWIGWASLAAAALTVALVLHGTITREYQRFVNPTAFTNPLDLRARLTDPANDGRIYTWRVAWQGFKTAPVLGHGAGTYADAWAQHRPAPFYVQDAHSLYMEVLDELGIVGFVLLVAVILIILVTAARRIRGPSRALYAAVFAVLLAWALHAGVDWDWEMPALSIIFFALGGVVLARDRPPESSEGPPAQPERSPQGSSGGRRFSSQTRVALGLGCLLLGVAPAYVWLAQRKINAATNAYNAGNCAAATAAALSSVSIVTVEAQPYEVLGYCDIRRGMPNAALTAIDKAVSLDPNNYSYALDLAVIRAAAGENPMSAARRALFLNPLDTTVEQVWRRLSASRSSQWQRDGMQLVDQVTTL